MSKIKTMKLIIIKFTAFLILTTLSSCGIDMLNRIEGNNNVISIKRDINEESLMKEIQENNQELQKSLKGQKIKKTIFVSNRLINIIL